MAAEGGSPIADGAGGEGELGLATRLGRALSFLDTENASRPASHDQGFYTAVSGIGEGDDKQENRR